jgi:8-oxo-dGTP diphosphatase
MRPYTKYKFAVIATDTAIFTIQEKKLKVLLIKMKKKPYTDYWALPGGLIDAKESLNHAAQRHLQKKTGVKKTYLEQLYTFGEVGRDPFGRVVSVAYMALIPSEGIVLKTTAEYDDVRWFSIKNLPHLAYDHAAIIAYALRRLAVKLEYSTIARNLLPDEFPFSALQEVYEIILGKALDKRNFRKRILALSVVRATGKKRGGTPNRPAALYTFYEKKTPAFSGP